jgi:ABC transporter transmembrane region
LCQRYVCGAEPAIMPAYGSIPKITRDPEATESLLSREEETPLLNGGSHDTAKNDAAATTMRDRLEALACKLQVCSNPLSLSEGLSTLWTNLVFNWFTPVLYRGNEKKHLDPEDMDLVPFPHDCDTHCVAEIFYRHWRDECDKARKEQAEPTKTLQNGHKTNSTPSLVKALALSFGKEFLLAGLLKFVHDCCIFVGPQVLNAMIYYLRDADAPISRGLGLTALVTLSQLVMSFCLRHYFFACYMAGLKIRTAIVVAVYEKALKLAAGERQTRTVGEITNLMSIDANRLQGKNQIMSASVLLVGSQKGKNALHGTTLQNTKLFA